ncbi:tRNA (adenosine(37)-N6)-threonylcarbamoyltransferase complex ATPase subunit type 1 TsaE [Asaia bogorensis]|uniref:tRNA (adenosine(37)-N6)-threonylcarbamoyltransferase complex ATPase subunit type 1 TsaE n=1 Tax=Asaia bogorensis TaxID=91915 RepID=UPI002862B5CC|nr:tRNA (adenosine(37)-N6)-threonylcarbamoyltransferase complex ATPase subunit type 1 TsaE [Asaia bogorensis]MDR6183677.1 tRNA threonylcarbamoyladenosine biosynthesis protein TsaE [Asaia bogorensis NBRC 16594]
MSQIDLPDQPATEALAVRLAELSRPGDVIALHGEMGMGKSVFARAFLRALADDPSLEVPSPTFSLVQIYELPKATVAHFDLWRLDGPDALFELGWDEVQEGIMLVEWPERAGDELPSHALHLTLLPGPGETERLAQVTGWDGRL